MKEETIGKGNCGPPTPKYMYDYYNGVWPGSKQQHVVLPYIKCFLFVVKFPFFHRSYLVVKVPLILGGRDGDSSAEQCDWLSNQGLCADGVDGEDRSSPHALRIVVGACENKEVKTL